MSRISKRAFRQLFLYFFLCLLIGFILGELAGATLVAKSNANLLAEQIWMEKNGYIAIPGTKLANQIKSVKTCLAGGLFFAFSVGLCYAFIWGIFHWIFRPFKGPRFILTLIICSFLLYFLLSRPELSLHWPFDLFILFTPLVLLALSSIIWGNSQRDNCLIWGMPYIVSIIGCIIITYVLFAPTLRSTDFIWIRDGLFERTHCGTSITRFYYHYTLYPARVIKSFRQRLQKSLKIETDNFTEKEIRILKTRLSWDDIFIGEDSPSDTIIKKIAHTDSISIVSSCPKFNLETGLEEFYRDPSPILKQYNMKTDWASILRNMIRISLFNIWPVMGIFYIFILILFICTSIFRLSSPVRDSITSFILITLFLVGLRFLIQPRADVQIKEDVFSMLDSGNYNQRLSAIIFVADKIEKEEINLTQHTDSFFRMINDTNPIIRRWGIDFLAKANQKGAITPILNLLNDTDPFVPYHAARALGRLKAERAKGPLLKIVQGDNEWYLKYTAYLALREIGWQQ